MHYKFKYPEFFDGVERPDLKRVSGNLVLYGAGFQGLLAAHLLEKQGIKVLCFGDRDIQKQHTLYHGIPVLSPEEMKAKYPDATVMVTPYTLSSAFEYVRKELQYKNAITPFSLFLEFDSEEFDTLPELPDWYRPEGLDYNVEMFLTKCINVQTEHKLFAVDLSVSERCTLKCKNCASFMPCYENPKDFTYEDVLNDISAILKGRNFHRVLIEGGEPFLWKPLSRLLNVLCEYDNVMYITPISNGTVIPDEELLKAMQHPKVLVRISDYGKYTKLDQLSRLFEKYHINYKIQSQKWYQHPIFSKERRKGEAVKAILESCCKLQKEGDTFAMDGKLFLCPIQANLHRLGVFPSNLKEYVDLRNPDREQLQNQLEKFINDRPLVEMCLHCNGRGYTGMEVPPAEQLKKGEKPEVRFE